MSWDQAVDEEDVAEIPPIEERVPQGRAEEEYMRRYYQEQEQRLYDWGERQKVPQEELQRPRQDWPVLTPGNFAFRRITLERFAVRYRNCNNELVEFEGNWLGTTDIPRFPFNHLRALLPSRLCICFQLGPEFCHYRRWIMVQVDLNVEVSLVSQHMLRSNITTSPVTPCQILLRYRGCENVMVAQMAVVIVNGKNDTHFEWNVGLVSEFSNPMFNFNRMIIGRTVAN